MALKIAIIGSGISGLAVAHRMGQSADITLFEAGNYFGGHTHTVDVTLDTPAGTVTHGVDTGFLVFNERTYPHLIALLDELGVPTAKSDMSFSVQVPPSGRRSAIEWSGSSLRTVFAQASNLVRPGFLRMLRDVMRFNRLATGIAERNAESELAQPLSAFLLQHQLSTEFRDWYLLPMLGCIWSCPTDQMLEFPVATMIRFCHNHGLIQVNDRPQWWTVDGGARQYVQKIVDTVRDKRLNTPVVKVVRDARGAWVSTATGTERFDRVVFACHSDQTLAMLGDASAAERAVLGAIRYQPNLAVLHTDSSVLPKRPLAWAAWNYERAAEQGQESARVCLHYLLNKLQPLPFNENVIVSLNPVNEIDPARTLGSYEYAHPVFDMTAIRAQRRVPELQGLHHSYFCGAWTGYGFHEDGLKSGLDVAHRLQAELSHTERLAA